MRLSLSVMAFSIKYVILTCILIWLLFVAFTQMIDLRLQYLVNDLRKESMQRTPNVINSEDTIDGITFKPWYLKGGLLQPGPDLVDSSGTRVAALWPHEDPTSDRVIAQLNYVPPGNFSSGVKLILLYKWEAWELLKPGSISFQGCPVNKCFATLNKELAGIADAVQFRDFIQDDFVQHWVRPASQVWIFDTREAPYFSKPMRFYDIFNWTSTYRRDSDLMNIYGRWVYYDERVKRAPLRSPVDLKDFSANKTDRAVWVVSHCYAFNKREFYAHELAKHYSVDIIGRCNGKLCPGGPDRQKCFEALGRRYKYYLAFENANCRDYITEKFFYNALGHEMLPIVMGASPEDYDRVAPHHSYIHVDEFPSPQALAAYLRHLDSHPNLYNAYFKWKGTGELIGASPSGEYNSAFFACRLCALLHDPWAPRKHYGDINAWWRRDGVCIDAQSWRRQVPWVWREI